MDIVRYDTIFDILSEAGIRSINDFANFTPSRTESFSFVPIEDFEKGTSTKAESLGGFRFFTDSDFPWIKDIYNEMYRLYPQVLESCRKIAPPRIISDRMYNTFGHHTWNLGDRVFDVRAKYGCIFPKKILFLSHQFIFWKDDNEIGVPIDFFALLFALKPVLVSGLAYLLPLRINQKEVVSDFIISNELIGTWNYRKAKNVIEIPAHGYGYDDLENALAYEEMVDNDMQLITLPWLQGARLEDYIEIVQQFPDEFELFSQALGKFIESRSDPNKMVIEWIKEIAHGAKRLDIIFKNKQKELRAKGMDVGCGMFFTLGAIMLPEEMAALKPTLTALFSSKTTYDGLRWLYDYRHTKKLISNENYWILWRLNK